MRAIDRRTAATAHARSRQERRLPLVRMRRTLGGAVARVLGRYNCSEEDFACPLIPAPKAEFAQ